MKPVHFFISLYFILFCGCLDSSPKRTEYITDNINKKYDGNQYFYELYFTPYQLAGEKKEPVVNEVEPFITETVAGISTYYDSKKHQVILKISEKSANSTTLSGILNISSKNHYTASFNIKELLNSKDYLLPLKQLLPDSPFGFYFKIGENGSYAKVSITKNIIENGKTVSKTNLYFADKNGYVRIDDSQTNNDYKSLWEIYFSSADGKYADSLLANYSFNNSSKSFINSLYLKSANFIPLPITLKRVYQENIYIKLFTFSDKLVTYRPNYFRGYENLYYDFFKGFNHCTALISTLSFDINNSEKDRFTNCINLTSLDSSTGVLVLPKSQFSNSSNSSSFVDITVISELTKPTTLFLAKKTDTTLPGIHPLLLLPSEEINNLEPILSDFTSSLENFRKNITDINSFYTEEFNFCISFVFPFYSVEDHKLNVFAKNLSSLDISELDFSVTTNDSGKLLLTLTNLPYYFFEDRNNIMELKITNIRNNNFSVFDIY